MAADPQTFTWTSVTTLVFGSSVLSTLLSQYFGWKIRKGDRAREDARRAEDREREDKRRVEDKDQKFQMVNSMKLAATHVLEHFVQRSSEYLNAIENGLDTWRRRVDDVELRRLNRSDFKFARPIEIAWDQLPARLVDDIKQIELGLARCGSEISTYWGEDWAEPDDIFERESQRVMVYGLLAAEIVERLRAELGLQLPERFREDREFLQVTLDALEDAYVRPTRTIGVIPELYDRFETARLTPGRAR
ncbi:hypothetical protein WJ59_31360 [Burkholderia gladioli]|uniref:hypothetical protein n=1 Tax=Burkholderia gladioli TaxID=28095 RepID=UPI00075DFA44|nr:hypothetical protein [Burkholderia gladioli]KVM59761.1 hypothetical protein WJ59_31360 [Burkholderia gladioli]